MKNSPTDIEIDIIEADRGQMEGPSTESEDVFHQMVEAIPAVFWMFSGDSSHVLYVSPAYEKIYGRNRESLYKQPGLWLKYIYPRDRQYVIDTTQERHGENYEMEYRILLPDGSIRWLYDRIFAIRNQSDKINCIVKFVEDITDRKRIEESLRDSFQRSVDIVKEIPSGLFIYQYEPEDRLILLDGNPAAERLTGIKVDEWRGSEINDILPQANKLSMTEKCLMVLKTGDPIEINELDYKDERFEGILRMRIFRMPGNLLGMAFENITELKKVGEREAQAYAQGRLEIVDTLLHNIGNAINSVTTGIGTIQENLTGNKLTRHLASLAKAVKDHQDNFVDYVKNNPQGQKVVPFIIALADDFIKHEAELVRIVNRVRERAQHIADIIRTEKALSKRNIYNKDITLRKAIDDAINVLLDSIKKRDIEIIVDCDEAPKEISTQESQFHQMLINLIKNSIEAIDDCRMSIKTLSLPPKTDNYVIKIKCYTEPNSFILEVTDNGIGIEKDNFEIIFRPGYTTKDSGSGLGLHSAANFVKGCGGQIFAVSDGIGKGTTMRVVMP